MNGTAVDAALATLFCNGVVHSQSMGIGGGFLMTIFIKYNYLYICECLLNYCEKFTEAVF
jgi:gamma-glutamyltranspeptidase